MVKGGAPCDDVGINRNDEGMLCGDVGLFDRGGKSRLPTGERRRGPDDGAMLMKTPSKAARCIAGCEARGTWGGKSTPHAKKKHFAWGKYLWYSIYAACLGICSGAFCARLLVQRDLYK
jgi:hypothetical protein